MKKPKKDKILLNLLEGEKHKHRVAMVNEEAAWNQHEPNSNMARMFVVMLLIHVVVIGGIIVYDMMNGEEAQPATVITASSASTPLSSLPSPSAKIEASSNPIPIEECATYEWRSGDSIASVSKKLGVTEAVLIKMNMLDKGTQLEANSIIRYPKQPVVKAVGISVAGANGELATSALPTASIAAAKDAMPLVAPGEQSFSFQPTIAGELAPTPGEVPVIPMVQDAPPAALTTQATGAPEIVETKAEQLPLVIEETVPAPKEEAPKVAAVKTPKAEPREEGVPKALPVKRYTPPAVNKPAVKKVADAAPAKKEPTKASRTYTVKSGETLYSIATRNGVSVKSLQAANKIVKPESLRDGLKLVIPAH
ncbi:MAG: LysM peptidoglycan-binding domain-containing protein [Verrucomicrobia bacterium]|nr:LysM peptidoglycan-binding domain-containing protein [Verrucomicrobiota bacterium]